MPTLAPKLPWQHAFAGGYPRRGGQPLPTDADAIDYLNRVKAADGGVSVEVGIAQAIDAFVRGCKADGTWNAIQASCILCGARTIAGALVPLAGTAPTAYGGWSSGDYNRETGLKGDGTTKYLDSNRANNADPQEDRHLAIFMTEESVAGRVLIGSTDRSAPTSNIVYYSGGSSMNVSSQSSGFLGVSANFGSTSGSMPAFFGASRSDAAGFSARGMSQSQTVVAVSQATYGLNEYVFARNDTDGTLENTNARLAFYSIGSAISDLSLLDARVSTLVSQIAAAIP